MKLLCCVKRVPITGGRMVLTEDAQALETKHLGFTISPHEECAVEEAVRIVEAAGGEVVVLTLGPAEAEEQLRDCMAIGADRGIHLKTDGAEWDAQATAADVACASQSSPCVSSRIPRSAPIAMQSRSCSSASAGPSVRTTTSPVCASTIRTASSTAHSSCGETVKPRCFVSSACASSVSTIFPPVIGTRLTQTRILTSGFSRCRGRTAAASRRPRP